ncbi:MAG: tetratricopeptide (TPR) repeat protein [Planctomycetota bacterium]|jgi:tetratricopeptide (TPR) repeat protein
MKSAEILIITIILILGIAIPADAQGIAIDVAKRGTQDFFIDLEANDTSILDILSVVATKTEFTLDFASPDELGIIKANTISVHLKQSDLLELVQLLGMSCGLHLDINGPERKIQIRSLPTPEDENSDDFFRSRSLDAVLNAYGGDPAPENEINLLLRSARLYEAGGELGQAYNAYERFVNDFKAHDRYAEVTLAAAEVAVRGGLEEKALVRVDDFLRVAPGHRDTGKALILGAKARLLRNDLRGAMSLYRTVIRKSREKVIPDRDGLIAEYYLAELHHKSGKDDEAIKLLEEIEWRHDARHNRDLLDQVWLYLGICRKASGNSQDALHDLNLATYVCRSPKLRIRILLLAAETHLELNNYFFALNAAKAAIGIGAEGPQLFDAMALEGRAYRGLYLHGRARQTLLDAVLKSPELLPDDSARQKRTTAAMREIGEALFEDSRFQEALFTYELILESIARQKLLKQNDFSSEFMSELKYMIARCQHGLQQYKEALATLDGISKGIGSQQFLKELRELRGDCFMKLQMYERAIRTWIEGDSR